MGKRDWTPLSDGVLYQKNTPTIKVVRGKDQNICEEVLVWGGSTVVTIGIT